MEGAGGGVSPSRWWRSSHVLLPNALLRMKAQEVGNPNSGVTQRYISRVAVSCQRAAAGSLSRVSPPGTRGVRQ
jgi:hypothetical protein